MSEFASFLFFELVQNTILDAENGFPGLLLHKISISQPKTSDLVFRNAEKCPKLHRDNNPSTLDFLVALPVSDKVKVTIIIMMLITI